MLAAAVDLPERFLMPQGHIAVVVEDLLHDKHLYQVVVDCVRRILKYRTKLVLVGCNFFMPSFNRQSDLHKDFFRLLEHLLDFGLHFAVVMG